MTFLHRLWNPARADVIANALYYGFVHIVARDAVPVDDDCRQLRATVSPPASNVLCCVIGTN